MFEIEVYQLPWAYHFWFALSLEKPFPHKIWVWLLTYLSNCLFPRFTLYHRLLYCSVFKVQLYWILSYLLRKLMEMRRIELLTPCLQGRCSPSWATPPNFDLLCVRISSTYIEYCLRHPSLIKPKLLRSNQVLLIRHKICSVSKIVKIVRLQTP